MTRGYDKIFIGIVGTIVLLGLLIFTSASLGLLARPGVDFASTTLKQIFAGLGVGLTSLIIFARIPYRFWRKAAVPLFVIAVILMALVLIPGIGIEANGARRWLPVGPITFQPAELMKFAFVVYMASWLSSPKTNIRSFKYGLLPFLVVLGVVCGLLLKQPDTGTFMIFFFTALAMFVVGGGRWKHFFGLGVASVAGVAVLAYLRPYVLDRITTFLDPSLDPHGASYQVRQALIAIGSGQFFGRGFGQSVQKFNFLPEPTTDSIFAVAAEEFGFVGSSLIVILFVLLGLRGLRIASHAPDTFGRMLAIGFTALIVSQSFVNIAAMLGIIPLTGVPLLFVSHGGTAFAVAMAAVGVILSVSRGRA